MPGSLDDHPFCNIIRKYPSIYLETNPVVVPKRKGPNGILFLGWQLRHKPDVSRGQYAGRNGNDGTLRLDLPFGGFYKNAWTLPVHADRGRVQGNGHGRSPLTDQSAVSVNHGPVLFGIVVTDEIPYRDLIHIR